MSCETTVPILLLAMSLEMGGAETHVVSLAKNLKVRGWDVAVASAGGSLVKILSEAGVPHVFAPLDSRSPLNMAAAARTIRDLVRSRKIGLIHAHARIPAWIAEGIARKAGIPMVVTYHGTFVSGPFWNFFTRPGNRTIAISPDIREYVVREFGFTPETTSVIPNGIDLDIFHPASGPERAEARESLDLRPDRSPVILYASRMEDDLTEVAKTAAETARILHGKYPELAFMMAGDGDNFEDVKAAAAKVNRETGADTVRCLGYVKDTFRAYAAADVVVGMSRVALESSASETPVIIAGPGGLFGPISPATGPALEERNFTTRRAPSPLTAEALAREIDALLRDSEQRRGLARFARELVASKHSMEHVTKETERVYRSALAGRNPIPS